MKYYLPDYGEVPDDAVEIPGTEEDPRYAAQEAAAHYHDSRDGWEGSWRKLFAVIDNKGAEHRFEVEREVSPTFRAFSVAGPQ